MAKSKSAGSNGSGERRGKATLGTSGNGGAVFQCTGFGDCRMVFTRSEHLARHIRKHTGERPFQCHCQKSFSRLDNLRQHCQTVHSGTPELNQELLDRLTALHTNLAASVAARNRHAARAAAKRAIQSPTKTARQQEKTSSLPPSQDGRNVQSHQPDHGPNVTFNSLLSREEAMESRYPTKASFNHSHSPSMMSYTRPAPYTYPRRPLHNAYSTELPSTRMSLSYPGPCAEYVPESSYQAESVPSSWKYDNYDSPSTKLPPLRTMPTGPSSVLGLGDGLATPMRPYPRQVASSPETRGIPALPPPTRLSRLSTSDVMLPPLSKSPAHAPEVPTQFESRTQDIPTSFNRPSLRRLDAMSSEPRPTRVVSGSLAKTGKYQHYSSMDEFQHSYYAAPCHGAMHRMMDISPAGLGLTSPTHSLSSRPFARYNGIAGQPLRSNSSFDAAKEGLRLRDPYQKTPTIMNGYARPANAVKDMGPGPVIPISIYPNK